MASTKTQEELDIDVQIPEDDFEDVETEIGDAWDFKANGALTGEYLGEASFPVDDRMQTVYQFHPLDGSAHEVAFVWASNNLRGFAGKAVVGDIYRITYMGKVERTNSKTGQTFEVNDYKVQHKAR